MFYRPLSEIKRLNTYVCEPSDTNGDGLFTNPTEFIPYSSLPYFSPTTIRNIVKALRNNDRFVSVHFTNSQFVSTYRTHIDSPSVWHHSGGAMQVIPVELFNVFALGADPSTLPTTLALSKGALIFTSFSGTWQYRETSRNSPYANSDRERWDRILPILRNNRNNFRSFLTPTKNLFLCRVSLTWLLTELHTIIMEHNNANKYALERLTGRNRDAFKGPIPWGKLDDRNRAANPNYDSLDRQGKPAVTSYRAARNNLRSIQRNMKIPYGYHYIFNKYPSLLFNFINHLSNKEIKEIRARYVVAQSGDDTAIILNTTKHEIVTDISNPDKVYHKYWKTTGLFHDCDLCEAKFIHHTYTKVLAHTPLYLANRDKYKTFFKAFKQLEEADAAAGFTLRASSLSQRGVRAAFPVLQHIGVTSPLTIDYVKLYADIVAENQANLANQGGVSQSNSYDVNFKAHPKNIPDNILYNQHNKFYFNERKNFSIKDHLELIEKGVKRIEAFLQPSGPTPISPPAPNAYVRKEPLDVLLTQRVYRSLMDQVTPDISHALSPYSLWTYDIRFPKETMLEHISGIAANPVRGYDTCCIHCEQNFVPIARVRRCIAQSCDPAQVPHRVAQITISSHALGGQHSSLFENSPLKYFHNLITYMQGGGGPSIHHSLRNFGIPFQLTNERRIVKNYSDNPLLYGTFSRSKHEQVKSSPLIQVPARTLGTSAAKPNDVKVVNGIDTTCYLGVELEVTANEFAFNRAREYLKRLGPNSPTDTEVKELGYFLAASVTDRFLVENNRSGILKHDGSVSDIGFELVSVPGTHAWHLNEGWGGFFKEDYHEGDAHLAPSTWLSGWSNNGNRNKPAPWNFSEAWDRPTCGIHVHVSRNALTPLQLGKMLVFVNANEDDFIAKVAGRTATYAQFAEKKLNMGARLNRNGQILRSPNSEGDRAERYEAINITGNKGTVEFRIFRSNVAKAGFFKCIDFVQATVDWTREESMERINNKAFVGFVMDNRSKYPWFSKWLIDAKVVQTVKPMNPKYTPSFADV